MKFLNKMCRVAYILLFLFAKLCNNRTFGLNVSFVPSSIEVFVDDALEVDVIFHGTHEERLKVLESNWTTNAEPANVLGSSFINSSIWCDDESEKCNGTIAVRGRFLGFGNVLVSRKNSETGEWTRVGRPLEVAVLRQDKVINKVFTAFVATVVSINYINMGCALDLGIVKNVLRRPIGPAVGFGCQFVLMPLVSKLYACSMSMKQV